MICRVWGFKTGWLVWNGCSLIFLIKTGFEWEKQGAGHPNLYMLINSTHSKCNISKKKDTPSNPVALI